MRVRRKHKKKLKVKNTSVNQIPGQVTYVGNKVTEKPTVEIINFDKEKVTREDSNKVNDAFHFKGKDNITWININGLNHTTEIEELGKHYHLHPLIIEDIVNTQQRPKFDDYEDYIFVVVKMLYTDNENEFVNEHLSIVAGEGFVLTFQEADGDVFDGVRERINNTKGRMRSSGSDYLMYALIDAVVDNYFIIIEGLSDKIETLEDSLFTQEVEDDMTQEIQDLKREVLKIRKAIHPLREVINRLENSEHELIDEKTHSYLRDLQDHITQISENIEIYREMIWSLMDMYMTSISNKMNEVMKVLTIMASIFIPLTFMAGIYGMNFEYMPELKFKYGYFYLWGLMITVFLLMIWYFRRKKWL
ncbi:magnesium/cobalt transporter CorA [Mesonia aestuariivivens]|uniref:Magnesium transport protein CorA n=1 Tax=Mesonia aestuariivivens TaxID=2796128 RepID=A0ABS6W4U7_9FLAO|nr:magnesium/cobalt transporter CorA [Mesonia aestuariivivens]MBW2962749.1 magnesium/cobalt transporter CorA [Mesonia aestuariivivens]